MSPDPVPLPTIYAERVSPELAASIVGIGNAALLNEPLLGLIASRECPGQILIDTIDRLPQWVKAASLSGGQGAGTRHQPLPERRARA